MLASGQGSLCQHQIGGVGERELNRRYWNTCYMPGILFLVLFALLGGIYGAEMEAQKVLAPSWVTSLRCGKAGACVGHTVVPGHRSGDVLQVDK